MPVVPRYLPLLFAWNIEQHQQRNRTRLSVLLPVGIAAAITIFLFFQVRTGEWKRRQLTFARQTDHLSQALRVIHQTYLDDLYAIEGLFMASQQVDRNEFAEFVSSTFSRHPGIQALEWIPRVPASQMANYQSRARAEGFPDFEIWERNENGERSAAAPRSEYYPVYYLEPFQGNQAALGFDLASNPVRLEALKRAEDTGTVVASARIRLIQEVGEQYGVLIFLPIYSRGGPLDPVESRRASLNGYALGGFRIDDCATNRLMLKEMLSWWGAKVNGAEDGRSGLAELQKAREKGAPYHLVLLDCRMPRMDGFEVAQKNQEISVFSGMPLVMLTSDNRAGTSPGRANWGLPATWSSRSNGTNKDISTIQGRR